LSCLPQTAYFNRTDVKKALHAPLDVSWSECGEHEVFVGKFHHGVGAGPEGENDRSADPIQHVLPQVIEATNRVIVSNADWDGLLLTNGTLLSVQNMTWNGKLGFQEAPSSPFIVKEKDILYGIGGPQGQIGTYHYERGLMWIATEQSGHMQPQYQPRATLLHIQWLLGKIDDFSG
jgi:carboxypeptidase D